MTAAVAGRGAEVSKGAGLLWEIAPTWDGIRLESGGSLCPSGSARTGSGIVARDQGGSDGAAGVRSSGASGRPATTPGVRGAFAPATGSCVGASAAFDPGDTIGAGAIARTRAA
jgi:hypothetical protein